ncbi:hypothetical protein ACSBR2_037449 [Camellia fascicularis]
MPTSFLDQLTKLVRNFLWKSNSDRGICWKKWLHVCFPREWGGLGFRDLRCFNQALSAKQAWRIMSNPELLLSKVLIGKYCQVRPFLQVPEVKNITWGWRSILWGRDLLNTRVQWAVGNGKNTSPFEDQWIPMMTNPMRGSAMSRMLPLMRVEHFIDYEQRRWRTNLVRPTFQESVADKFEQFTFRECSVRTN